MSKMEVPPTASKEKETTFSWTDGEIELLLECIKVYAATCGFEGLDWEGIRAKYDKIRELFIERYPRGETEAMKVDFPRALCVENITKERISAKVKSIRTKYKKAVDVGRRSSGGRIVMMYYDLCSEIWEGSPSTNSIEGTKTALKWI